MREMFFPIVTSVLAESALPSLLESVYDLSPILTCWFLHRGVNDTYLVRAEGAKYILRVYRAGWRSHSDILFEIDMLNHLQSKGLSISVPVPKKDGSFLTSVNAPEGERDIVLFTYAEGIGFRRPPVAEQYYFYGRVEAQMHNAWDDFSSQHKRFQLDLTNLLEVPLQSILPVLADRPVDIDKIQKVVEWLREQATKLSLPSLDVGICHGDLNGGNAHIQEDETITFFDFDFGGQGWRAYDLAGFYWSVKWYNLDVAIWEAFLRGYTEQRPLQVVDVQAIPFLLLLGKSIF